MFGFWSEASFVLFAENSMSDHCVPGRVLEIILKMNGPNFSTSLRYSSRIPTYLKTLS